MKMQIENMPNEVSLIRLEGRLDMQGIQEIDNPFAFATSTHKATILVDLSEMSFISSLGIRMLMTGARAQKSRGGSLALLGPNPEALQVLETTGVRFLMPIFASLEEALGYISTQKSGAED